MNYLVCIYTGGVYHVTCIYTDKGEWEAMDIAAKMALMMGGEVSRVEAVIP
jgi:ABC-type sugar transport system ATPase subunit